MFRPSLWKVVKTKKYGLDFGTILRFWPQLKNGPFLLWGPGPSDQISSKFGVFSLLRWEPSKMAKILLWGRYLWNGRSTSKIEESGLYFFLLQISIRGRYSPISKCDFLAKISFWGMYLWNLNLEALQIIKSVQNHLMYTKRVQTNKHYLPIDHIKAPMFF